MAYCAIVMSTGELYHHGILGQKWGVRNGPPYPLGASDHSARENKAGWKKSLSKGVNISRKSGAKYDFNKDITQKQRDKFNKASLYSNSKILTNYAANTAAKMAVKMALEEAGKESLEMIAGPAVGLAVKVVMDTGEKVADKVLTNKEKKKLDEVRQNETIDPNTGLHLKSKNDKSNDIMQVNPKYHDDSYGMGATSNCVRCTFAYDFRKRGYDVSAGLSLSGINGLKHTKSLYKGVVNVKAKSKPFSAFGKDGNTTLANDMISKLKSEPNSRGQILLFWPLGGGHSMAYEVNNGKVNIIDAQSGKRYSEQESLDILCCGTQASYQRLDNLEINESKAKRYMI